MSTSRAVSTSGHTTIPPPSPAKSIELQGVVLETLEKAIAAREAQTEQSDRIRALETEVTSLKNWDAEKQIYELKKYGDGSVTYMQKPDKRASEPAHWL
jgi:hypothetical protein